MIPVIHRLAAQRTLPRLSQLLISERVTLRAAGHRMPHVQQPRVLITVRTPRDGFSSRNLHRAGHFLLLLDQPRAMLPQMVIIPAVETIRHRRAPFHAHRGHMHEVGLYPFTICLTRSLVTPNTPPIASRVHPASRITRIAASRSHLYTVCGS